MRPKLLQPARPRAHERRERRRRHIRALEPVSETRTAAEAARPGDPDVARVREAGGPMDVASYSCQCGYFFCAPVSTTVACPHCGSDQAW